MRPDGCERRRTSRRVPAAEESLARVRLRTGREMTVINISSGGVLVEGSTRLLPGTHADVHVVTRHGRTLVRSRVLRSIVWHLEADAVSYRTALAFEVSVDTEPAGYPVPAGIPMSEGGGGNSYPTVDAQPET